MKQNIVIRVSMPCERSRSKAMALAARAYGVISVSITGDAKDRLAVVGDSVDPVCLAGCLRRKLGHAEILQVEEVKEKKPEEKKPEEKKPEEATKIIVHQQPYYYYPSGYHHPYYHHPPPRMVVCEEQNSCPIM
ncbi:hypothetical protein EJB05_39215 [Eragrostis curvula]|uniref:HMA domain-containing protein n=1 Tax=Eragrostis curvula TaxID=38414 RepID=A0A5J9TWB6_9POAL|nr:hypothetical protein EJB05_39196 [Eragrostis curvula]TVU15682.1 hypothetical protein EJB05_39215 [Eragrostis curvula]